MTPFHTTASPVNRGILLDPLASSLFRPCRFTSLWMGGFPCRSTADRRTPHAYRAVAVRDGAGWRPTDSRERRGRIASGPGGLLQHGDTLHGHGHRTSRRFARDAGAGRARRGLDTTVRIVTPERIVFEYPLAGPFRRAFAYRSTSRPRRGLTSSRWSSRVLTLGTSPRVGPAFVAYFVLVWGYGAFCETVFNGQTLGKRRSASGSSPDSACRSPGQAVLAEPGRVGRRADPVRVPARAGVGGPHRAGSSGWATSPRARWS